MKIAIAASLLLCSAAHGGAAEPAAHQQWSLGEVSRWDYVELDTQRQRLFVTRGERVQVLDSVKGGVVGEIAKTAGVHGVALAQDLKLGFTSNGRADTVTVFELDTLKVLREVKVSGSNPDAILYEPKVHKLYTFNGKSANVTVFDVPSMTVRATIPVGGKPEFAGSDGAGRIFVNIEDKAELVVIDASADSVLAHWPLKGCEEPTGLALDTAHARVFSVCQNKKMVVTDARSGKQVAELAIGQHPDAAAYDDASGTVYSSNGDGTLSVIRQIDADHYKAQAPIATVKGARTMALDAASGRMMLPAVVDKAFVVLVVALPAK
ncbi:MAG: YncE family protein [Pseudomonadota bacterium]